MRNRVRRTKFYYCLCALFNLRNSLYLQREILNYGCIGVNRTTRSDEYIKYLCIIMQMVESTSLWISVANAKLPSNAKVVWRVHEMIAERNTFESGSWGNKGARERALQRKEKKLHLITAFCTNSWTVRKRAEKVITDSFDLHKKSNDSWNEFRTA